MFEAGTQSDANTLMLLVDAIRNMNLDMKQVTIRLDTMNETSRPVYGNIKISGSNTDHGMNLFQNLERASRVKYAITEEGAVAIPLEVIENAANSLRLQKPHESQLVSLYTPYLMEIVNEVNSDLRLVNSEYNAWIQCISGCRKLDLKPDLFSAYYPLIEYVEPYKNAPSCQVNRLFGKFVSWESRESIHCIWDAKWKIDMAGFGEKCKYLQICGEEQLDYDGVALRLKGVLFDIHEFWMITSSGNTIVDVMKCSWSQNGSRKCLVDFLRSFDPWLAATNALCQVLNETVVDCSVDFNLPSAWMGSGANGRVFMLQTGKVIKVVVGKRSKDIEREYKSMTKCLGMEGVKSVTFPIVVDSYRHGQICGVDYAGYLLACAGVKILFPLASDIKRKLAEALYQLHANNIIHGDPRIQNALLLGGDVKWIDFRDIDFVTSRISMQRDVEILFESLGGKANDAREQIASYINTPSVENLCNVIC
jgi:hypothetical protein